MPRRSSSERSHSDSLRARLVHALPTCGTEADIVQLLYSELHPVFGYDPINLQVLEREGWYQHLAIDHGLLQDVGRRRLSESVQRVRGLSTWLGSVRWKDAAEHQDDRPRVAVRLVRARSVDGHSKSHHQSRHAV